MRFVLAAFALLLAAPQAAADNVPNISGFRIGMTEEEARLLAPDLSWPTSQDRRRFGVVRRDHQLGEVRSPLRLIFVDHTLEYAGGGAMVTVRDGAECTDKFRSMVEALEAGAGPLDDAPEGRDSDAALPPIETAGGSIIRRSGSATGTGASAEAHAPAFIEARAWAYQAGEAWQCSLSFDMSAQAPPPSDLRQSSIQDYTWLERPDARDFARYYPVAALEAGRPGHVVLICTVAADGAVNCTIGYEGPQGWGFGEAALRVSRHFRMAPETKDGTSTAGATVRVPIRFRVQA